MVKNLIRNGGFERGTIDFWTAGDEKSFGVVGTPVYKGSYAGKLVADGSHNPSIVTNDFFLVTPGEHMYFEAFLRGSHTMDCELRLLYYDEALSLIDETVYQSVEIYSTGYTRMVWPVSGIEGAMYVRVKLLMGEMTVDRYMLVDNVLMYRQDPTEITAFEDVIYPLTTHSSAGTYYSEYVLTGAFREAAFILKAATCAGTNETLDVTIESHSFYASIKHDIATFAQITAVGDPQVLVVTAGLGVKVRMKAVIGGTPTSVSFFVVGVFKR